MVPVSILYTSCHLNLINAPKVEGYKGDSFTPINAVWTATLYDSYEPGVYNITVALYSDVKGEAAHYDDTSDVPEWVPRPPDGWDLGVRIHAERLALDAAA